MRNQASLMFIGLRVVQTPQAFDFLISPRQSGNWNLVVEERRIELPTFALRIRTSRHFFRWISVDNTSQAVVYKQFSLSNLPIDVDPLTFIAA